MSADFQQSPWAFNASSAADADVAPFANQQNASNRAGTGFPSSFLLSGIHLRVTLYCLHGNNHAVHGFLRNLLTGASGIMVSGGAWPAVDPPYSGPTLPLSDRVAVNLFIRKYVHTNTDFRGGILRKDSSSRKLYAH